MIYSGLNKASEDKAWSSCSLWGKQKLSFYQKFELLLTTLDKTLTRKAWNLWSMGCCSVYCSWCELSTGLHIFEQNICWIFFILCYFFNLKVSKLLKKNSELYLRALCGGYFLFNCFHNNISRAGTCFCKCLEAYLNRVFFKSINW